MQLHEERYNCNPNHLPPHDLRPTFRPRLTSEIPLCLLNISIIILKQTNAHHFKMLFQPRNETCLKIFLQLT